MATTEGIVEMLGGATLVRTPKRSTAAQLHERIRKGLPFASWRSLIARLDLPQREVAKVLRIAPRVPSHLTSPIGSFGWLGSAHWPSKHSGPTTRPPDGFNSRIERLAGIRHCEWSKPKSALGRSRTSSGELPTAS